MLSDSTDAAERTDGASTDSAAVRRAGIDMVAVKPAEHDLSTLERVPVDAVAVDYEGREHLPDSDRLAGVAADREVVVTTPVRADGFDPLGDDALIDEWVPDRARRAVVAGHPAYLTDDERTRAVAPRFGAALDRWERAWVGTEGVERIAAATGATQYELLSRDAPRSIRGLRAAGFGGEIAVYAPTVLTDDEDAILDAVGDYVARRGPVAGALPEGAATDADAAGRAREVLSAAARDYALVGSVAEIRQQVDGLREAGATRIVGYPARGLAAFTA